MIELWKSVDGLKTTVAQLDELFPDECTPFSDTLRVGIPALHEAIPILERLQAVWRYDYCFRFGGGYQLTYLSRMVGERVDGWPDEAFQWTGPSEFRMEGTTLKEHLICYESRIGVLGPAAWLDRFNEPIIIANAAGPVDAEARQDEARRRRALQMLHVSLTRGKEKNRPLG